MESKQPRPGSSIERTSVSGSGTGRVCPHCGRPALLRFRRPVPLRWARHLGIDVRSYRCAMCGRPTLIRQRRGRQAGDAGEWDGSPRKRVARRRAAQSRGRRIVWCLLAVTPFLAVAIAGLHVLAARNHLLMGMQELRSVRSSSTVESIWREPAWRRLRIELLQAESEFAAARSDLRLPSPLLDRLGWLPVFGGELAAAPTATDAAIDTTRSALSLLDGLAPLEPALSGPAARRSLPSVALALQRGRPQFLVAESAAAEADRALHQLPARTGNRTLDRALTELRAREPLLRGASAWLAAVPAVLGMDGPSRYLLTLQDPAELRATGGFIGAGEFLTLRRGTMHTAFFSSSLPHEIGSVPAPLPEALYTPEGPWIFRDANWSPDFPLSARLARWFYGEDTGRWADGVVGVVDTAVVRLLTATGPVYIPGYRRWVDAANVEGLAQLYRTGSYHGPSARGTPGTVSKQFLGHVIAALTRRIEHLPAARLPALGAALADEIANRDIMLYDRRTAIEAAIERSGAAGRLLPSRGDFLAIVDDNRSYNKINPYVQETASYRAEIEPSTRVDATLTIRYHVAPSPVTLEGEGPGNGLWGTKHDYQDFLRVYVPAGAQLLAMRGVDRWAPAAAYGLTQFGGRVLVREGQTRIVTIHYRIPANTFSTTGFRRYLLTVRHQPGSDLSALQLTIRTLGGVTLAGERGAANSLRRLLSLERDAHLSLSLGGTFQPAPERLTPRSGPPDPYIPFASFRDPKHQL